MNNLIDLNKFINDLREERKRVLNRLNEINKEITAAETIKHARGIMDIVETKESVIPEYQELINTLNKKRRKHKITQLRAIEEIVNTIGNSDKKFKVTEVKNIMLASGFFKTPKNAYNIVHAIIERSEKFEKIEPGVYKLTQKENDNLF